MNSLQLVRFSLLGLTAACSVSGYGQTLDWRSFFSAGANSSSSGQFVEVHPSGNIYAVGATSQEFGTSDLLFQRYSSAGTRLWSLTVDGGLQQDNPRAMFVDGQGDTYVAGDRNNAAPEATVTKVGSWGAVIWSYLGDAKTYRSIKQGSSGTVVACGTRYGGAQGDNIVLTQLSNSGALNWQREFNSGVSWDDEGASVAVDTSGNIYVAGTSYPNGTDAIMRVMMFSSAGARVWLKSYSGTHDNVQACKILAKPGGGCVTLGSNRTASSQDLVISSYDSAGNLLWRKPYTSGVNSQDVPVDMAINSASQIAVSGYASVGAGSMYATTQLFAGDGTRLYARQQSMVDGNVVPTSVALLADGTAYVSANVTPGGFSDAALIKYKPTGARTFFTSFVVPGIHEYANRVTTDDTGRAIVVGAAENASTAYQDLMIFRIS